MPVGAGKYDAECQRIFFELEAETVVIAIINGPKGNGFSVNSVDPDAHKKLPAMLRSMADQIEASTS